MKSTELENFISNEEIEFILNDEETDKYINALLNKSEEAYLMALEIVNKPTINYRTEGFCFFICNAWELLLKTFLIKQSKNIKSINHKNDDTRTIGLDECIEKVFTSTTDKTKANLSFIRGLRNKATHLILPEYDFLLASAFQRCVTNYNRFFKKQFPNYNLNEKVTPFIALSNSPCSSNSGLELNPLHLIQYKKLISDIKNDENITQTIRLVSVKKESDADVKFSTDKSSVEKVTFVDVPRDIEKTHPYTTKEAIEKIKESIELILGPDHGFNPNTFQDICRRNGIKENQTYCYQIKYSKNIIKKYSAEAIEYISMLYTTKKCIPQSQNKNCKP